MATQAVKRRWWRASLVVACAAAGSSGTGCRGGSAPPGAPPADPSPLGNGVAAAMVTAADASVSAGGMPRIDVVLDDPRLAAARALERNGDPGGAAREVERVRATVALDRDRACAWTFAAARLHGEANEWAAAAVAYDAAAGDDHGTGATLGVAGPPCRLATYARLREAEAFVHAGFGDRAAAALAGAGPLATTDEGRLAQADASVVRGDRASAIPIWRSLLEASPHGLRWVDTAIQLARALLDGVDGPAPSRAHEAMDLVTRVMIEAPVPAEKLDATALRERAAGAMSLGHAPPLTASERARAAQAWLDASQPKRAREMAESVLRSVPTKLDRAGDDAAACKAAIIRAHALPHGHSSDAADAWGTAITRCRNEDALVTALYQGARASANAHRAPEALSRFAEVEKRFPESRFADDARFRAALVVADQGDDARSTAMLESVPDAYPAGDMGTDALFRVFLDKLGHHDLEGAKATIDRLASMPGESLGWGAASRAAYFQARVSELAGDAAGAKAKYAAIVAERPLSYYMLLAYGRLRALDEGLARATVAGAERAEAPGPLLRGEHPELESPAFGRFVALLEVGEADAARREANEAGVFAESADPEVLWAVAWLYEKAGAPDVGQAFTRTKLVDYRTHWPVGRYRGEWEIAYPRPWDDVVARESDAAGIPAPLTYAIMREESAFNPDAKSPVNALGLMQLMGSTARLVAQGTTLTTDEDSLRRPEISIALGARLLGSLRGSFASQPALAIAAYNGGANAVRRWTSEHGAEDFDVFVEHIGFDETRNYVKKVLASQAAYAYLYAPAALTEVLALLSHPG